jgi:hypothetical protein
MHSFSLLVAVLPCFCLQLRRACVLSVSLVLSSHQPLPSSQLQVCISIFHNNTQTTPFPLATRLLDVQTMSHLHPAAARRHNGRTPVGRNGLRETAVNLMTLPFSIPNQHTYCSIALYHTFQSSKQIQYASILDWVPASTMAEDEEKKKRPEPPKAVESPLVCYMYNATYLPHSG